MVAPAVFAFGLVAFGFLGMGPVTIAVDSYGPVTDNAQSVFELSTIEQIPGVAAGDSARLRLHAELREGEALARGERRRRQHVQGDGEAGAHRNRSRRSDDDDLLDHRGAHARPAAGTLANLSLLHPPFLLGLITGGAIIYWFTGASTQAVTTGAYRAVEFIKANMNLESAAAASMEDSKKVVEICTKYAQKGMFNIFLTVFFATLAFAFVEPYFFIGYLVSIALFGLYQAIFMANAGGAWDNAKKIVEVELKQKGHRSARGDGRRRHGRRSVQGHVVGRAQPDHQVHDAVRIARGRARGLAHRAARARCSGHVLAGCVLPRLDVLRVSLVLRNADRIEVHGIEERATGCVTAFQPARSDSSPMTTVNRLMSSLFSRKPIADWSSTAILRTL